MRDREFDFQKPPETIRILALGDSWTAGLGVLAHETWPKRVEALLGQKLGNVEVLNTGVSGYETYKEALYYHRDLVAFDHDMVRVGMYPVNDVHDDKKKYDRRKVFYDIHPLVYEAYMFLRRHLYAHHWYSTWRKERKLQRRTEAYARRAASTEEVSAGNPFWRRKDDWTLLYTDDYRGWRLMKESLKSIAETARASGVPVVVVLFPDLRDLTRYREYCHEKVQPLIKKAVEDAGLEFVDLVDDLTTII